MKILTSKQGSEEWINDRKNYLCASDAAAMLGLSKYKTRTELLKEKSTGVVPDINFFTKKLFEDGHKSEELARPIVENGLGVDFYPVVGVSEINGLKLLASFDGITLDENLAWENKLFNKDLATQIVFNADLPDTHWPQVEHQLLVMGKGKVHFTISDGTRENTVGIMYESILERRKQVIDGWSQFEKDLANYVPVEVIEKPKANAIMALPSLNIQLHGEVVNTNLPAVQESIATFIANIKTELVTDEDFSNAEANVKFCKDAEDSLENAKKSALSQTASIDELMRTIDFIKEQLRTKRLFLDKAVVAEKDKRKLEIINGGRELLLKHIDEFLPLQFTMTAPDFANAVKGKKTLTSMQSAVNDLLAMAKIDVDAQVKIINKNQALFDKVAVNHKFLFSDLDLFINNEGELFEFKVKDRISKYELEQKDIQIKKESAKNVIAQEAIIYAKNTVLHPIAESLDDTAVMHSIIDSIELIKVDINKLPPFNDMCLCIAKSYGVELEVAKVWIKSYFN